jgi:hypothetical protein
VGQNILNDLSADVINLNLLNLFFCLIVVIIQEFDNFLQRFEFRKHGSVERCFLMNRLAHYLKQET